EPPRAFWSRRFVLLSLGVILVSAGLGLGLGKVNTDPNLLDYFKPYSELRDGLEYVDDSGGASPLTLVVSAADGSLLNTDAAYEKLWRLHGALENYKDVGTAISLPTLLAEGDRTPFSFLMSYEKMTEMMEQPKYARVAKSFVTKDRTHAMFLLRMVETNRDKYRLQVIDDLRAGYQCLHRDRDRLDDPSCFRGSPGATRWRERLGGLGGRTQGTMAWHCLFRRDHRRRFCHIRVV